MNLKKYCKAGHLVILDDGVKCLLIPNSDGLQLVALGNDFEETYGFFDTGKKNYIWVSSLNDFDEKLENPLYNGSIRRIDKIYGLAWCGRFWKQDKVRPLLWQRSQINEKI